MAAETGEYYRSRAAEERDAAANAPSRSIFRFHDEMASMYERQAREAEKEAALAD